jgi:hypothetical protein
VAFILAAVVIVAVVLVVGALVASDSDAGKSMGTGPVGSPDGGLAGAGADADATCGDGGVGKPKSCPCNATITIGRVIRGNPYVPRNANTADGMPDSVPPSKAYELEVTVANWTAECAGKQFDLSIANTSADNGTATISPAQVSGDGTYKVTVTGAAQTKPGSGGQLKIQAKMDGAVKAESPGFTVCAHPVNYRDTFAADLDTTTKVGVVVQDGWDSDSGTFSDLDQAEDSEVVEYDAPTHPPYSGAGGAHNSGYQAANSLTQDTHSIGRPAAGPAAPWERRQVCIFKCHRCGVTDKIHPKSGFKIIHDVFLVGTQWKHHTRKIGAAVTARGYTSEAGTANVISSDHLLP